MHIRCPNCRKAIECVQRTPPCGSSMHLVIAKGILAQAPHSPSRPFGNRASDGRP